MLGKMPFTERLRLGVITQSFNTPVNYIPGRHIHGGYDIANPAAPQIRPFVAGTVSEINGSRNDRTGWGLSVVMIDGQGNRHRYAHLDRLESWVTPGASVSLGQVFAVMGTSGHSSGVHLHYEVTTPTGQLIDPATNEIQITNDEGRRTNSQDGPGTARADIALRLTLPSPAVRGMRDALATYDRDKSESELLELLSQAIAADRGAGALGRVDPRRMIAKEATMPSFWW